MRAFGHAFYLRGGPENTCFEDCYVEGKMRPTDDILAETSGPAHERDFRSSKLPINIGWRRDAKDHTLINHTTMPVAITARASNCKVQPQGEVLRKEGTGKVSGRVCSGEGET